MNTISDEKIYFAKMRPDAIIPSKKAEDAGYDIYACFDGDYFVIEPLGVVPVPTGIAAAFSPKYYIQVEERSSTGKLGIKKSSGVMDSGYRGEYLILTFNTNSKPLVIAKPDIELIPEKFTVNGKQYNKSEVIFYSYKKAIAELVVHILPSLETEQVTYEELLKFNSDRGVGGFGSSNK